MKLERAIFEKKPSTRLSHDACFGVNAALGLRGEPSIRLFRDVGRMVVEDQFYRRIGRIGCIEPLEEADVFPRPMAFLDTGMHLAGQQIDPGQQAQCAMTFVFMVAREVA